MSGLRDRVAEDELASLQCFDLGARKLDRQPPSTNQPTLKNWRWHLDDLVESQFSLNRNEMPASVGSSHRASPFEATCEGERFGCG